MVNASHPGSDVAAEPAAALAAASMVFRDGDREYAELLLDSAKSGVNVARTSRAIIGPMLARHFSLRCTRRMSRTTTRK